MSDTTPAAPITFDDFMKVDVRVGVVRAVHPFPEARKPASSAGRAGAKAGGSQITTSNSCASARSAGRTSKASP